MQLACSVVLAKVRAKHLKRQTVLAVLMKSEETPTLLIGADRYLINPTAMATVILVITVLRLQNTLFLPNEYCANQNIKVNAFWQSTAMLPHELN